MKKIIFILFCSILFSCSNDDDSIKTDASLLDNWDMKAYVFFGPSVPDLEAGDVTWNFSSVSNTLTIVNTVEDLYPYLPESGVYSVTVLANNEVVIEGLPWGNVYEYEIVDNELLLNFKDDPQIADDELFIRLERI
ncbi:MAG: hypothetical protein Aureis2KO_30320 [Aureisphaera sp.]